MHKFLSRILVIFTLVLLLSSFTIASSQRYPFTSDLITNAVKYEWDVMPAIGINLINNGLSNQDSLEIRLFFDTSGIDSTTICNLGARLDLGVLYGQSGYSNGIDSIISDSISKTIPQKYSYNAGTGKNVWYYPIKLNKITLLSGTIELELI